MWLLFFYSKSHSAHRELPVWSSCCFGSEAASAECELKRCCRFNESGGREVGQSTAPSSFWWRSLITTHVTGVVIVEQQCGNNNATQKHEKQWKVIFGDVKHKHYLFTSYCKRAYVPPCWPLACTMTSSRCISCCDPKWSVLIGWEISGSLSSVISEVPSWADHSVGNRNTQRRSEEKLLLLSFSCLYKAWQLILFFKKEKQRNSSNNNNNNRLPKQRLIITVIMGGWDQG